MRLSAIAAVAENYVIGVDNALPWHLPADLRWFVRHTKNKPIVSGRHTFASTGRLPNRLNIVVTSQPHVEGADVVVASFKDARRAAGKADELMILGGGALYQTTERLWDRLYLTVVHARPVGDTYFPPIDANAWEVVDRQWHPRDAEHAHAMTFLVLDRIAPTRARPALLPAAWL